jgi:hypothetical protein
MITEKMALTEGYGSMTQRYVLPNEAAMLANVVADMRRTGADFALVETGVEQVEVWRK